MRANRSLNGFLRLRDWLKRPRTWRLRAGGGVRLAGDVDISATARLHARERGDISVGDQTTIGPLAVLCAESSDGSSAPIVIGERCFIGGNAVIGPGVRVGDGVVVAGGAVVLRDVPGDCIVAGNPARIVRRGIGAGRYGRLPPTKSAIYERKLEDVVRTLLHKTGR